MNHVLRKTTRPFRRLSDTINKLPLVGKFAICPALFWAYTAPSQKQKLARISVALLLLAVLIFFHYVQMKLGWGLYTRSSLVAVRAVGMVYLTVNALVIYTHCVLSLRLMGLACRSYHYNNRYKRRLPSYTFAYFSLCMAVTFGGQAAFTLTNSLW